MSVALADDTRIDEATLVSVVRASARTLWLYSNGVDLFVPFDDITDLWQTKQGRIRAA